MIRNLDSPVILPFPAPLERLDDQSFDRCRSSLERIRGWRLVPEYEADDATDEATDDALAQMRSRLHQMILDNERMRFDGPQAS